ncbi:MAG: DUF748 domain-containing protein, partial [Maricaulaceae bacterium]
MAKTDETDEEKAKPAFLALGEMKFVQSSRAYWNVKTVKLKRVYRKVRIWLRKRPLIGKVGGVIAAVFGEIAALALGLTCLWMYTISGFLAAGSADLSFFKPDAQRWFQNAFEGHKADVGILRLDWNFAQNSVIFHAANIEVYDTQGMVIERFDLIESEHALEDVMQGKVDLIRLNIQGGEASFVRSETGDMIAGLGRPNAVGSLGPVWRGAASGERPTPFQNSRLKELALKNVQIHIEDSQDGLSWHLDGTELSVSRTQTDLVYFAKTSLSSQRANGPASFAVEGRISRDLQDIETVLRLDDFNPARFMPERGRLAALRVLNAPLDLKTNMGARRGSGLESFNVSLDVGEGRIHTKDTSKGLRLAKFDARYQPEKNALNVQDIEFESEGLAFEGQ